MTTIENSQSLFAGQRAIKQNRLLGKPLNHWSLNLFINVRLSFSINVWCLVGINHITVETHESTQNINHEHGVVLLTLELLSFRVADNTMVESVLK